MSKKEEVVDTDGENFDDVEELDDQVFIFSKKKNLTSLWQINFIKFL